MNYGYLKSSLTRIFRDAYIDQHSCPENECVDSGTYFGKFITLSIHPRYGVPRCVMNVMSSCIPDSKAILLPFHTEGRVHKHFESAIKYLLDNSRGFRFRKLITTNGNIYYGGNGIILDKDFQPLLVCYTLIDRVRCSTQTVRISSKVFTTNKMLERGISRILIPMIATIDNTSHIPEKIKVAIDDFEPDFALVVEEPKTEEFDIEINNLLVNSLEEIKDSFSNY